MRYFLLVTLLALGSARTFAQNDLAVTSFTLVNADTDEPIGELTDGAILDFAELGTDQLSVVANTSPASVGSVVFALDDNPNYQVESLPPYDIAGDATQGGVLNYSPWTPSVGDHTLTATPYSEGSARGSAGTPLTVRFTVVDETVVDEAQTATEPPSPAATPTETAPAEPVSTEQDTSVVVEQPTPAAQPSARVREERFEVVAEDTPVLRGSVLVADYGLDQAVLTVLVSGTSAGESYPVLLYKNGCNGPAGEALALDPLDGRAGLSANAVPLGYDELLTGEYSLGIRSSTTGRESVLSCTLLGR